MDKDIEIQILQGEVLQLKKIVLEQAKIIEDLKVQICKLTIKKNSNNSSIPPSTDLSRKNSSLRTPGINKPGGQPGHEGKTLEMTETPDNIIKMIPNYCNKCGRELSEVNAQLESKRQVVEIPPVNPIYIEYQSYSVICKCGHKQMGDFPKGVTNHIQYGASVEAMVSYQSVYQYMPFKRLHEFCNHFFHLPISEGSIDNILKRFSAKAFPIYQAIKDEIENSTQIGGDETGAKVNGKKWWVWTWQNAFVTFISISSSRGKVVIDKLFPNGFINAVLNSDRWRSHLNTYAKGHQLCIAHILRELKYLIESEKTIWAENLKQLLLKSLKLKKECLEYARDNPDVVEVEKALDLLLLESLDKKKAPKTLNLQESFEKYRDYILTFLYHAEVPPDNNGSERAIRNVKVKQKVSGQFKTGQDAFCIIRSIIDTCIKKQVDVFDALNLIAQMPINQQKQ